ncbi:hypothetical protein E3P99_02882 [Wallemia hederae]|uniref:Uncharacterized protein n=1 Tax=Wallemia hederae TaxID=1540922 RepID=A0A4T0FJX6_9BASI|nr:hypothetical protein E3P99_02882 [Wallemia hederae]
MAANDNLITLSPVDFSPPPLPLRSNGAPSRASTGSSVDASLPGTATPPPPLPLRKGSESSTSNVTATASALSRPQPALPASSSKVKSSIPIMPPPVRIGSPASSQGALRGGPSTTSLNRIAGRSRSGSVSSLASRASSSTTPAPASVHIPSVFRLTQPTPVDRTRYQDLYARLLAVQKARKGVDSQSLDGDTQALDTRIARCVWKASKLDTAYLETLYNNSGNKQSSTMDQTTFVKCLATIDSELRRRKSRSGSGSRI